MNENSLHFAQPLWILAGIAVCACILALYIRFDRKRERDLAKLIHPRFRQRLSGGFSQRLRNVKRALILLAVLSGFVAVARPQKGYEWREVKRRGIDILFALDTSRSMLAQDLSPNRLERAKLGIIDFVGRLEGDRVGLVPFAGSAFALCPLTMDYGAFRDALNVIDTDLIPRQGTDLASAVTEAERLFDESGNNHRILVLITDGEDLQGEVKAAIDAASKKNMAIYTIGVGSTEGAPIPIHVGGGMTDYVRDENGKVVQTALDENTLKEIAEKTNALYFPLGRGAEGLDKIYQERLRLVPKSERDQRMERVPLERFEWPLGLAIVLLVLESFMNDRRREKKVKPLPSAARRTKIVTGLPVALLAWLAVAQDARSELAVQATDARQVYNDGTKAYESGDFSKATESLKSSLGTADLALQQRSYYNLGNALYRTGQAAAEKDSKATLKTWEEAVKAYQDALALNPSDEDAQFNKDFVEKKIEELKQQQNQDQDQDKDQKDKDQKDKDQKDKDQKDKDQKDQDQKDQDQKDQDQKDQDQKDQDQKDSGKGDKDEDKKDKEGMPSGDKEKKPDESGDPDKDEKEPAENGKPDKKKDQPHPETGDEQQAQASDERRPRPEMTQEEAMQLLDTLRQDEKNVVPLPQQRRTRFLTPQNSTKGKTW